MPSWQQIVSFVLGTDQRLTTTPPNDVDQVWRGDRSWGDPMDTTLGRYTEITDFDDFVEGVSTAITTNGALDGRWLTFLSGTGASVAPSGNAGCDSFNQTNGCATLNTGTLATGVGAISRHTLWLGLGALEINFRVGFLILPSAAQNTTFEVGLLDSFSNGASKIGLVMQYSATPAAPVWFGESTKAGVTTLTSQVTSPTILAWTSSALTFYKLRIVINAAWTSVTYFVNGVQIGSPITTNIPTGVSALVRASASKSAGTSTNQMFVDKFSMRYKVATP
jgi:hypothetical protein